MTRTYNPSVNSRMVVLNSESLKSRKVLKSSTRADHFGSVAVCVHKRTHRGLALRLTDAPIFFNASVIFSSNWACLSGTHAA